MGKNMNFKDEMKQKVAQIEIILDEYLPAQEGLQKTVLTAMNTTVKAGGKRLRPMRPLTFSAFVTLRPPLTRQSS